MVQSKNKFLPTIYIRKCKITYLECLLLPRPWLLRATVLFLGSVTLHLHTIHTHVRAHEQVHGDGVHDWSWGQAGAGRSSCREGWCPWDGGERTYTGHTERSVYGCEHTCVWCDFCVRSKGKEAWPREAVAHSTSCQKKYCCEALGFHRLVLGVELQSVPPVQLWMTCGTTWRFPHARLHLGPCGHLCCWRQVNKHGGASQKEQSNTAAMHPEKCGSHCQGWGRQENDTLFPSQSDSVNANSPLSQACSHFQKQKCSLRFRYVLMSRL